MKKINKNEVEVENEDKTVHNIIVNGKNIILNEEGGIILQYYSTLMQ